MREAPQPQLNGAYYGPSIPPPTKSSYRPGRRGGGGGLLGCLCSCVFNLIFQIICTILVILGVIILIFWLIYRPQPLKFRVTDATLTQFDYSTDNKTLFYNLAVNMTVRNPNKRLGVYYDKIEARALYEGERIASYDIPKFYQGHKSTEDMFALFQGQNIVELKGRDLDRFNSEKTSGTYSIDVKLYMKIRFKVRDGIKPKFKPRIECELRLPLDSNGKSDGTFETKKCDFDWRR
ncbi:hypothetical protein ACET3Z_023401 [Daucus carota]